MASYGYLVYLVRAGVPYRPTELYRLDSMNDADDLLTEAARRVRALGGGYQALTDVDGYRVKECVVRGRTLWVRINRGPRGAPGETFDLDTRDSVNTTDRQALLSQLRAMLVVPRGSFLGLLFAERIGNHNLKEILVASMLAPAGQTTGSVVRCANFAESADWRRDLHPQQVLRVTEFAEVTESGHDASTDARGTLLKIDARGRGVTGATDVIKEHVLGIVRRAEDRIDALVEHSAVAERKRVAGADAFTVEDEAELQRTRRAVETLNEPGGHELGLDSVLQGVAPLDRQRVTHRRYEVTTGVTREQRTFVIERQSLPQFVYQLGGRLTDGGLRDTWVQHAGSILGHRGVDMPRDWHQDGG